MPLPTDDKIPHQKSLVIISLGFILFKLGEGEIKGSITFALVGVKLNDPYWLGVFAWIMLFWSFWRFWINNPVGKNLGNDVRAALLERSERDAAEVKKFVTKYDRSPSSLQEQLDNAAGGRLIFRDPVGPLWLTWIVAVQLKGDNKDNASIWLPWYRALWWKLGRIWDAARTKNGFADYVVPVVLFVIALILQGQLFWVLWVMALRLAMPPS